MMLFLSAGLLFPLALSAGTKEDALKSVEEKKFAVYQCNTKLELLLFCVNDDEGIPKFKAAFKGSKEVFENALSKFHQGTERYQHLRMILGKVVKAEEVLLAQGKRGYPEIKGIIESAKRDLDRIWDVSEKK